MQVPVYLLVHNAVFFGAALLVLWLVSIILSRLTGRILGFGLRVLGGEDRGLLQAVLVKRTRRVIVLSTAVLSLALIAAAVLLSLWEIDVTPPVRRWTETAILRDPAALAWLLGEVLVLMLVATLVHRLLRSLISFGVERLQGNPAFVRHHTVLERLLDRVVVLLRWGVLLGVLLAAAALLGAPPVLADPLTAAALIVVTVLGARALVVLAHVGIDITFQLVHALEGRPTPLRHLGRLEHLASITKRTVEYFCFVGAATLVVDQLRPDTWLSQSGVVLIRLIAMVYVGRVVIEVLGLVLREVLLADPDRRSAAEQQQRLTLLPVATSVLRYGVYFCLTVMGLQELGVDTSPILAGAGLLGLAVGLGAQAFVGDVVSGFFILFEGLFLVGDRIRVGEVAGNVEEIGVRMLKIRDEFGVLHCIPNGEVRLVANHARQYVHAVVEFVLPYDEDVPQVLAALQAALSGQRARHPDILADTELTIQDLTDNGARVRTLTRARPSCDDAVADVVRAELLAALTALGVAPGACHVIKAPGEAKSRPPRPRGALAGDGERGLVGE